MNTIVAILMYLGIATSPVEVNDDMVRDHSETILDTVDDPSFINYFESQYGTNYEVNTQRASAEVVIWDVYEGD
jgi:hypothetical protein